MPLYFLHSRIDDGLVEDPDGSDLPDLEAARSEALAAARDLWSAAIVAETDLSDRSFEIVDAEGKLVMEVPFVEALPASLRARLR